MRRIALILLIQACGTMVEQRQSVGGEAEARVLVDYPLAQRCFDDTRITTYDELKECLEITTNNTWTIDVDGELSEYMPDDLVPPENITGDL